MLGSDYRTCYTTLRLKQRKLCSRFFVLARKDSAGLLAASQGCPQNRRFKLRGVLYNSSALQESNENCPAISDSVALLRKNEFPENEIVNFTKKAVHILEAFSSQLGAGTRFHHLAKTSKPPYLAIWWLIYNGAEGGRTPVRRPEDQSISERSLYIDIPSAGLPQTGFRLQ